MNSYMILAASLLTVGAIVAVQMTYTPAKKDNYTHSSTDFIEPDQRFLNCSQSIDCIKIKGSACPTTEGGVEVCINKNHFQEYISAIDAAAGNEAEVACPQVITATDRVCRCIDQKCNFP
jgi:hypothetical protein